MLTPRGLQIDGPQPRLGQYGLFSVSPPVEGLDPHWEAGVEWEDIVCADVSTTLATCDPPGNTYSASDTGPDFGSADPFIVYGSYKCSVGGRKASDAFDIAEQRLRWNEQRGVENTFWTGLTVDGTINPSLSAGDSMAGITPVDLTPGGGAVDPILGMSKLEDALGDCVAGLGVIHAGFSLAAYLKHHAIADMEDGEITSPVGYPIVLGAGYPQSGPANVPAGTDEAWMFGTGPIKVLRSEIYKTPELLSQAVDRQLNNIEVRANRTYAVGFSCCLYAILISLCG